MPPQPNEVHEPHSASSDTETLLDQIDQACRQMKMAQTTFGRLAVNDGKLVTRLQQGARVTLQTVDRVHQFIEKHGGAKGTELRSAIRGLNVRRPASDFRFYDNRRKYLMFVNVTSEKQLIADRALREMADTQPQAPAIRLLEAGAGDGTSLARTLRGLHRRHPSAPFYVVAKETSMENVRLILEKMADRFQEHPETVLVLTNLPHPEALRLKPRSPQAASKMIWNEVPLDGSCAGDFEEQIATLDPWLGEHWQAQMDDESGGTNVRTPVVLVLYRRDHRFALDLVLPRRGLARADYDFILLSQPYRARASLAFKTSKIVTPLVRGLRTNGKLMGVQSFGNDAGMELIRQVWPDEDPFVHGRADILKQVEADLGSAARDYRFHELTDEEAILRFNVRTTPNEISTSTPMGNSTIMAAWNSATFMAQIEDDRLAEAMAYDHYRQVTRDVLLRHGGLWFNDEVFLISRLPTLE